MYGNDFIYVRVLVLFGLLLVSRSVYNRRAWVESLRTYGGEFMMLVLSFAFAPGKLLHTVHTAVAVSARNAFLLLRHLLMVGPSPLVRTRHERRHVDVG